MSSRVALPRLVSGPGRTLYWVVVLALIIAVMVMASPSASWAQAVTGTLLGTVTDAQGAGVPGATATVTETGTNISRTAQTNSSGHYIFSNLRDGRYRVVEPQVVVEVAFDVIMRSARHKSGFALRFPRIANLRPDKPVSEIDTLATVTRLYEGLQLGAEHLVTARARQ